MLLNKKFFSVKSTNDNKIKHGFFTRLNGFSKKKFKSLNCSLSNGDEQKVVLKNREIALKELKLHKKKLILLNQIHSSKVIRINKNNLNKKTNADGMITSLDNIALGVLTADCAPIFIYDNKKKFICCLHSGWKGTLNNISRNAIKLFDKCNIKSTNLTAIIGPCLGAKNYEVDKKFEGKFIKKNVHYGKFFRNKNKTKSFFNLRGLIKYQLQELGLKKIHCVNLDTYNNKSLFFSHRRSTHKGIKSSGRLINIISLA